MSNKMRFHVLGIPHTITSKEWSVCPFTTKVWKFCHMMTKRGHHIIHYGHQDSVVDCTEHVTIITNEDFRNAYGDYNWKKEGLYHYQNNDDYCHRKFNDNVIKPVLERLQQGDFLLCFWGRGHEHACTEITKDKRAILVEMGVGYALSQSFCELKIFESYAYFHEHLGSTGSSKPSWFNCVIPLSCDVSEFEVDEREKEDYFLHLGRIDRCKGLDILMKACKDLGYKLKIAGTPINEAYKLGEVNDNVELVGCVGPEERKILMNRAKALVQLSDYAEPFGAAIVEAQLSGCPVITSDWGGFTETVLHGYTGYRVRSYDHLIWAMKNINSIKPDMCRKWAETNYNMNKIALMYEEYFTTLKNNIASENKWYNINEERTDLDWLKTDFTVFS